MEETKGNHGEVSLRPYWCFFLPLTTMLIVMVEFPLRIDLRESFADALYYGTISLICIATAIRVYRRFGKHGYRLIALTLLCSVLSGWQVVDMMILRLEGPPAYTFAGSADAFEPLHDGWAWYGLRFRRDDILCHSLFERYIGNNFIAIAYDIDRNATRFACGG
jgi:hypothetical protein